MPIDNDFGGPFPLTSLLGVSGIGGGMSDEDIAWQSYLDYSGLSQTGGSGVYDFEKDLSNLRSQYNNINGVLTKLKSQSKTFVKDYGKFEVLADKQWKDYQAASKLSSQIAKDLRELGIDGDSFTREYDTALADAETIGQASYKATENDFKNYNDIVDLIE